MENKSKQTLLGQIDYPILVVGLVLTALMLTVGIVGGTNLEHILNTAVQAIMTRFKWLYILLAVACVSVCIWLLCSRFGNIRLGGSGAKPTLKTGTWFALSFTGGIAVGICFYGVAGPLSYFLNPPPFLGLEGGTADAVIPALVYTISNWALTPYVLLCFAGMALAYTWYNMRQPRNCSSALYPLLGDQSQGVIGKAINAAMILMFAVGATNMGLSASQLSSGIAHTLHIHVPLLAILVLYFVLITLCTFSGLNGWMSKISNFNVALYAFMMLFILLIGPTDRLLGTFLTAVGDYLSNYVHITTFADPVLQTGWMNTETMFYYAWNIAPCLTVALFYAKLAYGRTLKQFILVQMVVPTVTIMLWYSIFGGSAIYQVLDGGSNLGEVLITSGNALATFAFLDKVPLAFFIQLVYLVMVAVTYVTCGQSCAVGRQHI